MVTNSNFWLTTVEKPVFPEFPLPENIDVAVIGGGLSGLSAAHTLAKAGAKVIVLESETIGWGASSRNGGMVLSGLKLGFEMLIRKYGKERARRLFELSLDSIDTVEKLIKDESIDCAFSRCGHLEVAWKPSHYESYARTAEIMKLDLGYTVRIIPRIEQRSEIGSDQYFGGIVDEHSASVNPAQLVFGLAKAAARAGAVIHEKTNVINISRQTKSFSVQTNRGTIKAEKVFAGTSGYSGRAIPYLQKRLIPIASFIIVTEPLSAEIAHEISPHNRMIFDSKNFLYYFRLTPDNRFLFGGRAAFMPETANSTKESSSILYDGMVKVFPQLKNIRVEYVWGGALDFALDSMPHIGSHSGIYHSVGYAGHGVAFATHLGKIVAQQMLEMKLDNPLDGLQFSQIPLYNGSPWFLPLAGIYYKLLDIIS